MSEAFCFTWNNYLEDSIQSLQNYDKISYCVVGKEVGEEGTPHLQGYLELAKQVKYSTIRNLFPGAWFELRGGTQEEAINYCKKGIQSKAEWLSDHENGEHYGIDADVTEWGVKSIKNQGRRTDIEKARSMAKVGGMRLVTKKARSLQSIKVAALYLEYNEKPRDYKPTVTWITGKSGSGKSRLATELAGKDYYRKSEGSKWWPGYDGHETVILDDFRGSWWCLNDMITLVDRYGRPVECKGGNRQFLGRDIYITSIHRPDECYINCVGEPVCQLLRRIDRLIDLDVSPVPIEQPYGLFGTEKPQVVEVPDVIQPDNIDPPVDEVQLWLDSLDNDLEG